MRDDFLDDAEDTAPVFDFFKGDQRKIFEEAVKNLAYFGNSKTYVSDQELLKVVEEIETIVKDSKPFGKIQRLPELNQKFEALHMGLLEKEAAIMDPLVHDDFLKVNEHIEPRNPRKGSSTKTLDYSNIVASCNNADRCGAKKGNDYEVSEFISPLNPECEDTFIYYPDGEMEGNDYTIGLLNLNCYELKEARKAVYHTLSKLDKSTIEMIYCQDDDNLSPFHNVIRWVVKNRSISIFTRVQ